MLVALQKNCGITYMQHFNRKCARTGPTAYVTSTQSTAQGATSEQAGTMAEATEGLELTEAKQDYTNLSYETK